MADKFDSFTLHIESSTLSRLQEVYGLIIERSGKPHDFDRIVRNSLGAYKSIIKAQLKKRNGK